MAHQTTRAPQVIFKYLLLKHVGIVYIIDEKFKSRVVRMQFLVSYTTTHHMKVNGNTPLDLFMLLLGPA
jgi:hypothetical protein